MKKLFLSGVILFLAISMNAQGNMQFNQVKHLTYNGTLSTGLSSSDVRTIATITVPASKIWKVESGSIYSLYKFITSSLTTATNLGTDGLTLLVDKQIIMQGESNYSNTMQRPQFSTSPIWLGAGTYSITYYADQISTHSDPMTYTASLSILEFNIIQ
ncbi:MAG TPA: hypothetical protein VK152_12470 [Paludibacter sp.]|nr:hypothetical protein [Paludibacter sp.]